ncbi:MAG: hypothetical protein ABIB47_03710 [Candidatus Woesearchaeota archaeon]
MIEIKLQEETIFSILRRSLIFASLIGGVYFVIKSFTTPSVTGAVVGTSIIDPYIALGVAFLLLALAITHFWHSE